MNASSEPGGEGGGADGVLGIEAHAARGRRDPHAAHHLAGGPGTGGRPSGGDPGGDAAERRAGRRAHAIQWDVTRAAFETPEILARYPEVEGVTPDDVLKQTLERVQVPR